MYRFIDKQPKDVPDAEVMEALRSIGTNSIPSLLAMIRAQDYSWYEKLSRKRWFRRMVARHLLPTPAPVLSLHGKLGFEFLGADAQSAVPGLIKICEQTHSISSKMTGIDALGDIGSGASDALPMLLQNTTNSNADIRYSAIITIYRINSKPELVVPVMTNLLHDGDQYVRQMAADVLGNFGTRAKAAVPALTNALNDSSIAEDVGLALKRIDPEAAKKAGVNDQKPF